MGPEIQDTTVIPNKNVLLNKDWGYPSRTTVELFMNVPAVDMVLPNVNSQQFMRWRGKCMLKQMSYENVQKSQMNLNRLDILTHTYEK